MIDLKMLDKKPLPSYPTHPKFGTAFTPHLLQWDIDATLKTQGPAYIKSLTPGEPFSAATLVLHYGQSIFEGMKAFRQKDGSVAIFRAELHAERFAKSAVKMAMPEIATQDFLFLLKEFVKFEQESVPSLENHALYLRPLMIARDEIVKVGKSKKYSFYILACVVGSYFAGGPAKPARVLVCKEFVRTVPGGLGEAKTAANYAASLFPQSVAEKLGCDQVLYLDALHHDFIDELGGMNFFVVRNGEIITPELNGSILHGVTRKSILEIAPTLGLKAREEKLSFTQVAEEIKKGTVTEAFACGTAAVIHSIGEFLFQQTKSSTTQSIKLGESTPVAQKLLSHLSKIQRGETPPPAPNWLYRV